MADTSNVTQNLSDLLKKLHISEEPLIVLEQLKLAVHSLHPASIQNSIPLVSIVPVFDRLNSSNNEQIEICCEILSCVMHALPSQLVLVDLKNQLQKALDYPNTNIKLLAVKQLLRCKLPDELVFVCKERDYIIKVIQLVGYEELEVANKAIKLLIAIGLNESSRDLLLSGDNLNELKKLMTISDTVRYRVYEVVVEVGKDSESSLASAISTGLLTSLLAEYSTAPDADVLVQMTCLQMLTELVTSRHGLLYLHQQGVLRAVHDTITMTTSRDVSGDIVISFTLPALIKLLGHASVTDPVSVCEMYPGFLPAILYHLHSSDTSLILISIETLALFALTAHGKQALEMYRDEMRVVMKVLGEKLSGSPTELRVAALHALADLLRAPKEVESSAVASSISEACQQWFLCLPPSPGGVGQPAEQAIMLTISKLAQQPFTDIRCAALKVIHAILTHEWGQRVVRDCAGLLEHLLNRNTESDKAGKDIKFDIMHTLVASATSESVFGTRNHLAFRGYLKEGAHYVDVVSEVAIEEA